MPVVERDGVQLHHREHGEGTPVLMVMAAHGRVDALAQVRTAGERALHDAGIVLPPEYPAMIGSVDDRVVVPAPAREVAAAVPGARYVEVEGCGHFGYLERPEVVNELVLAFLAETAPVGVPETLAS